MSNRVHIERRLAAVAFADVAGFSHLIELDDVKTTRKWGTLRENLIAPKIAEHFGRLVRTVGDGLLIEFHSVVDAVVWASDVQRAISEGREEPDGETLSMRIAINVEDVLVDGDDLHGDGVNIAARIQQLANPGEVVVTAAVSEYVRNKLGVNFIDVGLHKLKNISRPVQVYRLELSPRASGVRGSIQPFLAWTNKPSIAVLPFRNLSGDPAEGYFGEGITEEIIAALARNRSLLVIARHSTLHYADRHADIRQISSELGVRYVLDGSVRRQARRLRISAELIDAGQNRTLWADRFEGSNQDLFRFQDDIAASIVATIEPRLLILDKQSYSPHIGARDFCWHGWGHEEAGRSCGAGGTAVAGRAVAATRGTSGRSGAAAGREPNLGWTVGRRAQVERCGWLAQSAAHRAAAAADRGQEEAFGCRAGSRGFGAGIFHGFVDAGAGRAADRKDQRRAVFGVGRLAAAQETELFLPTTDGARRPAR